jgi:hypothetical protein
VLVPYAADIKPKHIRRTNFSQLLPQVEFRDSADMKVSLDPVYYFSPLLYNPTSKEFALQVIIIVLGEYYSGVAVFREEQGKFVMARYIHPYIRYD